MSRYERLDNVELRNRRGLRSMIGGVASALVLSGCVPAQQVESPSAQEVTTIHNSALTLAALAVEMSDESLPSPCADTTEVKPQLLSGAQAQISHDNLDVRVQFAYDAANPDTVGAPTEVLSVTVRDDDVVYELDGQGRLGRGNVKSVLLAETTDPAVFAEVDQKLEVLIETC